MCRHTLVNIVICIRQSVFDIIAGPNLLSARNCHKSQALLACTVFGTVTNIYVAEHIRPSSKMSIISFLSMSISFGFVCIQPQEPAMKHCVETNSPSFSSFASRSAFMLLLGYWWTFASRSAFMLLLGYWWTFASRSAFMLLLGYWWTFASRSAFMLLLGYWWTFASRSAFMLLLGYWWTLCR